MVEGLRKSAGRRADQVVVIGHSAAGTDRIDGQIYRTRLLLEELQARLGPQRVVGVDTSTLKRQPLLTLRVLRNAIRTSADVLVMPGERGLRWLFPLYFFWSRGGVSRIHYVVVGGWLPGYVDQHPRLLPFLRRCATIHVQTARMERELRGKGLPNVHRLENFRSFPLDRSVSRLMGVPLQLVFMSRVIPRKGLEECVRAVTHVNHGHGEPRCRLEVWGPIPDAQRAWFASLIGGSDGHVRYRGVLDPADITGTLTGYDAMLFPTYWGGEGFPGVVIDAFSAGIPIVISNWKDNAEFVADGETGLLVEPRNAEDLATKIEWLLQHPDELLRMKQASADAACRYHVDAVIPPFLDRLGLCPEGRSATAFATPPSQLGGKAGGGARVG